MVALATHSKVNLALLHLALLTISAAACALLQVTSGSPACAPTLVLLLGIDALSLLAILLPVSIPTSYLLLQGTLTILLILAYAVNVEILPILLLAKLGILQGALLLPPFYRELLVAGRTLAPYIGLSSATLGILVMSCTPINVNLLVILIPSAILTLGNWLLKGGTLLTLHGLLGASSTTTAATLILLGVTSSLIPMVTYALLGGMVYVILATQN